MEALPGCPPPPMSRLVCDGKGRGERDRREEVEF